jgi:hypothetical protein
MWAFSLRNAIYSTALVEYMTTRNLISLEQVSAALGSESLGSDENEFAHYEAQLTIRGRINSR